jgi:hypothetical protein
MHPNVKSRCISHLPLDLIISDPARCSDSGGARGVGGLTCGLELELQLSDRIDITFKEMNVPLNQKVHNDATRHSASNDPSTIKVFKE